MTHRYRTRLRTYQHDPSGPHATRAIIDRVTITGTTTGDQGGFSQLTATAYDVRGHIVTGMPVTWRSAQPFYVDVSATGLLSFILTGSSTITATVDGRAYTVTATASAQTLSLLLQNGESLLTQGGELLVTQG